MKRPAPRRPIQMQIDRLVRRRRRGISMVPLIDVVFILLLFFMLSTSLIRAREIPVDFPTPDAEASVQQVRIIRLDTEEGSFSYEGRSYAAADFDGLRALVAEDPLAPFAIDTAPGVSTQALVSLLDRLKLAGADNLSLMEGSR